MAWLFPSLRGYQPAWLRGDLIAGLTVWAVLVPESLAYASIAGVSPVVGLYAAPPALVLYALFGSSRHLIVGPMSATAALSAATVADLVAPASHDFAAFTAALAIATGAAALVAGVLRLGFVANFISEPVLKGFIIGLALTIIIGQVPKLLGVSGGDGDFFEKLADVVGKVGDTHGATLVVGLGSLAVVLGLRRVAPIVPGSLAAVALAVAAVQLLDLDHHGVAIVGHIDAGLPSVGVPAVSLHDFGSLAAGGVAVMLVGFAEGLAAAKTYAAREHYDIDADRELVGLGAANAASGLVGGMVVNGSLSKTAVNGGAGAHSQVSGLAVAVLTVVTLLFLTGLFEQLPEATLAAVVIAAVIELVDIAALVALHRVWSVRLGEAYGPAARPDFIAAVAALLGVLVFDTLPGLFIGIGVSLVLLLFRASRPHVAVLGRVPGTEDRYSDVRGRPGNRVPERATILRVESGLFFANADVVRRALRTHAAEDHVDAIILDAEAIPSVDISAARMLSDAAAELRDRGVTLLLVHGVGQVRDVLRAVVDEDPELQIVYPTIAQALAAAAPPVRDPSPRPGEPASPVPPGGSR
ncbi:MAG: sulfate transporter [Conexibacter sp.]|nr:sulfate transporter [Conexibacter sp.]